MSDETCEPATDASGDLSLEQKVDQLTEGMQWLLTAVHHIGQTTEGLASNLNFAFQGLMASPMGGAIRKAMEGKK